MLPKNDICQSRHGNADPFLFFLFDLISSHFSFFLGLINKAVELIKNTKTHHKLTASDYLYVDLQYIGRYGQTYCTEITTQMAHYVEITLSLRRMPALKVLVPSYTELKITEN